jgi:acetyl-CoA carboxylase carboxyl transferase subunit alpha
MATLEFEKELVELRGEVEKIRDDRGYKGDREARIRELEFELEARTARVFAALNPWEKVQLARHADRPHTLDYVDLIFTDFVEMHGDRHFGDDAAVVGGPAKLGKRRVMVIGHQKGRDTTENVKRNFGMASPEGFRKARRLMVQAEKFGMPVITLLDIPGASPVLEAEERGQAWAIADNLLEMVGLRVPIVVTVVGEGGSGGALALGIGDRILMLEHSVYSVASPEGAASIVWRDHKFAEEAAAALKLTPPDLVKLGVVDRIVPEPAGGAHNDFELAATLLGEVLMEEIDALSGKDVDELLAARQEKFRSMGRDAVAPV